MNMTWRQLLDLLSKMDEKHLDDNVTVFTADEFFPVSRMETNECLDSEADGVLDKGHSFLVTAD